MASVSLLVLFLSLGVAMGTSLRWDMLGKFNYTTKTGGKTLSYLKSVSDE